MTPEERDIHDKALVAARYWQQKAETAEAERDALAARYAALAGEVRDLIQDSDGLAGYHLNGEVACWSELEVGHLLGEPDEAGKAPLEALKAEWQAEVIDRLLHEDMNSGPGGDILPARMWKLANELRRQAPGGE